MIQDAAGEPPPRRMRQLFVHVRGKVFAIPVGNGTQPVQWLANVGIARYEQQHGLTLGGAIGVKVEDGALIDEATTLLEAGLGDGQHVWVVLRGAREELFD